MARIEAMDERSLMPKPDYTTLTFRPAPAERPYVYVNMVMSIDGKIVIEGTEKGLGSPVDQRLMRELRVHADVVMNGAGTLRASGTSSLLGDEGLKALRAKRGKPKPPISAVISRSGDLPLDRAFFTSREFEAIVFASAEMPAERKEALRKTGRKLVELPAKGEIKAMLAYMRLELGAEMLLVEGGATFNRQLFDLDAVDEYFTTVGSVIVGGKSSITAVEGDEPYGKDEVRRMDLVHAVVNEAENELYLRYRRRRG